MLFTSQGRIQAGMRARNGFPLGAVPRIRPAWVKAVTIALCVGIPWAAASPFPAAASPPAVRSRADAVAPAFTMLSQETAGTITVVQVSYPSGPTVVRGSLFLPAGSAMQPGLVFVRDGGNGLSADVTRRARDLAEAAYIVLVPLYQAPAPNTCSADVDPVAVRQVVDGARALARHPRIRRSRVGILGSGHGGLIALLAVMDSPKRFACAAQASGVVDVPRVSAHVKIPVLLQHGWKDNVVEIGDAMYLSASMRRAGNSWARLKEYTLLGHGLWYWNDPVRYSPDQVSQAEWAWSDLLEFLNRHLGPRDSATNLK